MADLGPGRLGRGRMGTAVEVFWGDKPEVRSEREFLSRLINDLKSRNLRATIMANFFTGTKSRQIDFFIVTDSHVCHVELKNYNGVLVGPPNGPWSSRRADGTLQVIEGQNPYHQAFGCKTALSDDMHMTAVGGNTIPRPPGTKKFLTQFDSVICVFPRLADGSEVASDYKVQTLGYQEFLAFLTAPGRHPAWRPEHWKSFIRDRALVNSAGPGTQKVHRTAAASLASDYRQRFGEFYQHGLHELVPLPLSRDGEAVAASSLDSRRPARHLQIIGPSGCGKSHLLKHMLLQLDASVLPMLVEGGMYEGRLSSLMDRSIARFTTISAPEFLRAAAVSGQAVLLAIDGYNECPERFRATLAGDLSAFCLRTETRTIITTQARAELPAALMDAEVHAASLEEGDRLAVLDSYGAAGILTLCDPFATPYELSVAAECAAELDGLVTRGALFASFIRKRLSGTQASALVRDTLRQLALAMDERLASWLPLDEVWRISEEHLARLGGSPGILDEVLACTITKTEQGRLSFSHELLARFLTVEALRRDHGDPPSLAARLRLPRHADLPQLAAELETDRARLDGLLAGLADWLVYFRALRGETGRAARHTVRHAAEQLLQRVIAGLATTTFTIHDQFQMTMVGGSELPAADRALLGAIGALLAEGEFVAEIAGLLDATDAACQRSADVQARVHGRRPTPSLIVSAVLEPFTPASRAHVAAAIVMDAVKMTRYDRRLRRHADPRINIEGMVALLEGATPQSYGRLLLLCHLIQASDDLEAAALVPRLLRLCWASSAYHIRLDSLAMTRSFARTAHGHSLHEEIADALTEIRPPDNWALSTMLVESLDSYGLVESPYDEDVVRAQIEQVLSNPSAQESRELAYSVVGNQFEDVVAEPYVTVINDLSAGHRTLLYTCASLGSPAYGFWNDWLLEQLVKSGDESALPAFERWATRLHTDNPNTQEIAKCYALAVQGWAQLMPSPPALTDARSDQHAAWECYGAIIYWMHRAGLDPAEASIQCAPYWQRLRTGLLAAAADPLYWLRNASQFSYEDGPSVSYRIMHAFSDETRPILEWSLRHPDDLISIFPRHASHDRAKCLIDMLGSVGNADSAELLRPYADDPLLGSAAIMAIKLLGVP